MGVQHDLERTLAGLEREGLLRRPVAVAGSDRVSGAIGPSTVVNFCSNDYLGLAGDPRLVEAVATAAREYGVGAGASRLVSGTHPAHHRAERALADWVGQPAALLFSSGYAANLGALSTLLARGDVAFSDALNHASLIDGLRLSRAEVHIYPHADLDALAGLLRAHRHRGRRSWVVTDAIFSMDGDLAPLRALRRLADTYDAGLYVDEAHALGVLGDGRGACRHLGVTPDALIGTLGKSVGAAGAFVAGSHALRTVLENRARSYVFSTGVPPMLAATLCTAVELAREATEARALLRRHGRRVRAALRELGRAVPDGDTPIVPVRYGDPDRTMTASAALLRRGYFVQGIRPPTVPAGTSRLRVVPTAGHTHAQVEGLLQAFAELDR